MGPPRKTAFHNIDCHSQLEEGGKKAGRRGGLALANNLRLAQPAPKTPAPQTVIREDDFPDANHLTSQGEEDRGPRPCCFGLAVCLNP